ncbi:MAG: DUF945 family protein [Burkholderiaceae bacterium]
MKLNTIAASVATLFVIGAAGATAYGGHAANEALDQMVAQAAQGPMHIEFIERSKGFTESTGSFRVAVSPDCFGPEVADLDIPVMVHYTVNHLPGLRGLASYSATVELEGDGGEFLVAATGKPVALELDGGYGFNAEWTNRFSTPALTLVDDDKRILVAASSGEFVESDKGAAVGWRLPSISVDSADISMEMVGLSMASRLHDVEMGLGEHVLAIEKLESEGADPSQSFVATGLQFNQVTSAADGFVTSEFTPSVSKIDAAGESLEDLSVKLTLGGLDERALREINAVSGNGCHGELNDTQLKQIEESLLRLIDRGVTFSITDLEGRKADDRFSGDIRFTMDERIDTESGRMLTLGERVKLTADLQASSGLVPMPVQEMVVEQGFAVRAENALRASLAFGDGSLMINGRPDETGMADTASMFLAMGEDNLAIWQSRIAEGNGPLVALAQATR